MTASLKDLACRSTQDDLLVLVGPSPVILQRIQHIRKLFPGKRILLHDTAPWLSRHYLGLNSAQPTRVFQSFDIYLPRWVVAFKSIFADIGKKLMRRTRGRDFKTRARSILADPALLIQDGALRSMVANFLSNGGELFLFGHGVLIHPNLSDLDDEAFDKCTIFHFCRSDPLEDLKYLEPKYVSLFDGPPKDISVRVANEHQDRILVLLRKPNSHQRSQYRHQNLLNCVSDLVEALSEPLNLVFLVHPNTPLSWAKIQTKWIRLPTREFGVKFNFERFSPLGIQEARFAVTSGSNLTIDLAMAGVPVFQVNPIDKTAYDRRESLDFWTRKGLAIEVDSGRSIATIQSTFQRESWAKHAQKNALELFGGVAG